MPCNTDYLHLPPQAHETKLLWLQECIIANCNNPVSIFLLSNEERRERSMTNTTKPPFTDMGVRRYYTKPKCILRNLKPPSGHIFRWFSGFNHLAKWNNMSPTKKRCPWNKGSHFPYNHHHLGWELVWGRYNLTRIIYQNKLKLNRALYIGFCQVLNHIPFQYILLVPTFLL